MSLAIGENGPTPQEVERLRLILSTYQDGTGQLPIGRLSIPGWRDFERAIALVFEGQAVESKAVFDVLIPFGEAADSDYGVSCKMRSTLNETQKSGRVTIELSNSAAKFTAAFEKAGIPANEMREKPRECGSAIFSTVREWHEEEAETVNIDLLKSSYFALSYNKTGNYQLHQFALELPNAEELTWSFPDVPGKGGILRPGRRLRGSVNEETVIEYYYGSGGQLKYYPSVAEAIWQSDVFRLESLDGVKKLYDPEVKAAEYFPEKWKLTFS